MLNHPKPNQTTRSHKPHENLPGKRSAGNPHAAFEEAGAGNELQKAQTFSKHVIAGKILEAVEATRQLSTLLLFMILALVLTKEYRNIYVKNLINLIFKMKN